jgi:DNA-binding transcriptional LysR family regulator
MSPTSPAPNVPASTLLNRLLARTRLRQLQLLVLTAELGSIQRAVGEVGMSQPAATKAIAEIERLVGTPLFERHARGMRPTFACRDLLPLLRSLLRTLTGCAESLAASAEGVQGLIRIGAVTSSITGLLGEALPAFLMRHPQLRVEVVEDAPHVLQGRFADGTLDLLLVREPTSLVAGCRFLALLQDRAVVVTGPGHPLLRRREVQPEQLLDESWVLPPLDSLAHWAFERLFARCGRTPANAPLTTRSLPLFLVYLRHQRALSIVPASFVQPFVDFGLVQVLRVQSADSLPPIGVLAPEEPGKHSVALLRDFLVRWSAGAVSS